MEQLIKKKILRQKVNSQQGYEDWIVTQNPPIFDTEGNCYFALENKDNQGIQYFSPADIADMTEVGVGIYLSKEVSKR